MPVVEPGLTTGLMTAAAAFGLLAASQDGPGWKQKIFSRLRRGKGASALTDTGVHRGVTGSRPPRRSKSRDVSGMRRGFF